MNTNKIQPIELLKRIGAPTSDGVSLKEFADFLKKKVDKGRDISELEKICILIDIDKDGFICHNDISTCTRNLNSTNFFKDNGKALTRT